MFFSKSKKRSEEVPGYDATGKPFLVWLELGVKDIDRATAFYQNVFKIKVDIRNISGRKMGIFERKSPGCGVCLIEREDMQFTNSIKPTFQVDIMHDCISRVKLNGGKIISEPELLKQQNVKGETLIGANLIDNEMGYMAEISDTEGNSILIYSHY
jgi:uncharacterized protein